MRPLFGATDQTPTPELMQRIQYQEPERVRKVNPAVASDLEAVVLKCLEKDPARRYSSAALLADDLARFQRGELVTAQPLTLGYAAGKFIRRHRLPITLASGIVAAAIAGTALSFYQIQMALREARSQRNEAQRQRNAAQANFRLARRAVDEYFTRVSENTLLDVPGMEPLRQDLLEAAQSFYEEFLKQHSADPLLEAELANAYARVGWIRTQSRAPGAESAALEAYRKALAIREKLARDSSEPARAHDLGHGQTDLGNLLHDIGQTDEAGAAFQAALRIREELARKFPADAEYQVDLASIHNNLGNLLRDTGQSQQALAHYTTALEIRRKLLARDPVAANFQEELARSLINLSRLEAELGHTETAVRDQREAEGILESLSGESPAVVRYQMELAASQEGLGVLLGQVADPEAATQLYRKALAIREKLAREHPTVSRYERDLARSRYHLASLLGQPSRPSDEDPTLLVALLSFERLARDHPGVFRYQIDLANAHNTLGDLHAAQGKTTQASDDYQKAVSILEPLSRAHPNLTRPDADLGLVRINLGDMDARIGRLPQAEDHYRSAIRIFERLAGREPEVLAHRADLAKSWFSLGKAFDLAVEPSQAKDAFEKALAIRTTLAHDDPALVDLQNELASSYEQVGHWHLKRNDLASARSAYQHAADVWKAIHAAHPDSFFHAINLAAAYMDLGRVASSESKHQEAAEWFGRGVGLLDGPAAAGPWGERAREKLVEGLDGRAQALAALSRFEEGIRDLGRALELATNPAARDILKEHRALARIRQGDHARAAEDAANLARNPSASPSRLYNLACVLSLAAKAAGDDSHLDADDRLKLRKSYAKDAVDLLERAAAGGFFDDPKTSTLLRDDPDLASLRPREDFQALLVRVTKTPKPASAAPAAAPSSHREDRLD